MKENYLTVFALLALSLMAVAPAIAQGTAEQNASEAGVLPDSFLYDFDVIFDDIRHFFALGSYAKAKIDIEIANERLEELRIMVVRNKIDASRRAGREHERVLKRMELEINSVSSGNESSNVIQEIEATVNAHEERAREVSNRLKIKIRTENPVSQEEQALIESILEAVKNKTGEVKIKINEKKTEIRINIRPEKENEEDGDEDDDDENEDNEGKGNRKNKNRAQEQIEDAIKAVNEAKAALNSTNASSEQRADALRMIEQAEKRLEKAEDAFEDGKYGKAFGQANSAEKQARNAIQKLGIPLPPSPPPLTVINGTITGMKFHDIDGDGAKDANETGLANRTIMLGANNTATTNENGTYRFDNIAPGSYNVSEAAKAGWINTTQNPVAVNVTANSTVQVNFGNFQLASISGFVFNDSNNSTLLDANETGLADRTVMLTGQANATAQTNASGAYSFTNLLAGTYTVSHVIQANWTQTSPANGTYTITITSGVSSESNNFGNIQNIT